ncbi:MAG: preprotein translocase subunit SecA [Bacteroidetes bacterium]|nr:preprotein translocase subunit SecA [Bacteroidota bacterium]
MLGILKKIFGDKHERDIKNFYPIVDDINIEYEKLQNLSDDELKNKTLEFKKKISNSISDFEKEIEESNKLLQQNIESEKRTEFQDKIESLHVSIKETTEGVLNQILPEAFAVVKETCHRLVGKTWDVIGHPINWEMVPYDVQLMGGIVLHNGKISEMATGEGKTLVATLPIYLNALTGKGVHLVTVNDYLAKRDSEWMAKIFEFHGLTVGCILQQMDPITRRKQYSCDITYGTNNEFGFDYLRDNMVINPEELVQRGQNFAIVDEVDSVLVDEARTPLIISGPVEVDDNKFAEMNPRVNRLVTSQKNLVAEIVNQAEKLLNDNKTDEAGILILRAQRGMPKNKKLMKLLSEGGNKKLMLETEAIYIAEQNKRLHEIDDELFYSIDEKSHIVNLSEKGRTMLAGSEDKDFFVLPDIATELSQLEIQDIPQTEIANKKQSIHYLYAERSDRIHTVHQLLKAYSLFDKDDEYVVTDDGKVMIVDEFTGRLMHGRRYSDGLHQAIEAKEGVKVERDTQTLATVTLQNYFRLYTKLSGMTGTAETEAGEFFEIYKLDVVVIPTNKPINRVDSEDQVYKTKREKYNAVITEIEQARSKNQPILVGTTSVEVSETISRMLKRKNIPHNVLNAKQHQREAEIISYAGLSSAVTIATNMAGRGTDIKLGPGVKDAGGLHIIGTERHEARRIDRQLRGRSGRQGDLGSSQFFLSLEDDLMRLFGSDRIAGLMERLGLKEGEVIQHGLITKSIERAQKKVEENNFGIRKRLLEYDNVMNQQREVIYSRRRMALVGENLKEEIINMVDENISSLIDEHFDKGDFDLIEEEVRSSLLIEHKIDLNKVESLGKSGLQNEIFAIAKSFYEQKEIDISSDSMRSLERMAYLQVLDLRWKEHLRELDDLKEGIHLRAYGQKDPLLEYKAEAFGMFTEMINMISRETVQLVYRLYPQTKEEEKLRRFRKSIDANRLRLTHDESIGLGLTQQADENVEEKHQKPKVQQIIADEKVGRNELCPCGSGKKYKNCHGV